ncbi:MAG: hypothetical protein JNM69_42010 [Archangium sp.]|nr:hypothetical protein [Archangium sp.]
MTPSLRARAEPLPARAVVAERDVARRLATRLLALDEATRRQLQLVVAADLLVALGPADMLPWVDGVRYLGAEPESFAMLMPTTRETTPSSVLVERALRRAHHLPDGPFALLSLERIVPLGRAVPVSPHALAPLLEQLP